MANRTTYEILAKTKGFKNSEKQVKGLNGALGGLAKKAIGVAGAYFGTRALLDGINASIEAFKVQEQAEKMLEQALGGTSQALLDQASALQKVSTSGDEAIIQQQAFLASIGMTEDQIKDILPVALDLAAATGLTLESAVRNTAKTFSGLAGELGELVPQVRDLTPESMKAGEAVEVMGKLFGGAAKANATTLAGRMERVQGAISDMAEDIGEKLAPALDTLAFGLLKVMGQVDEEEAWMRVIEEQKDLKESYKNTETQMMDGLTFTHNYTDEMVAANEKIRNAENELNILRTGFSTEELERKEREKQLNKESHDQSMDFMQDDIKSGLISRKLSGDEIAANKLKKLTFKDLAKATHEGKLQFIAGEKERWAITASQAVSDSASAVIKAIKTGGPFPANLVAGAITLAQNAPQLAAIYANKPAQYGFEGVVSEPTQFTVGEHGASEYVSVQPMEGANNAASGGSSIVINNPIISSEFVESELPELIAEAVRKGADFGMS